LIGEDGRFASASGALAMRFAGVVATPKRRSKPTSPCWVRR